MATKNSTLLNKRVYQGEDGNVSKEGFSYTLASAQIGDVINGLKFPAGTKATGVEYINAALGTNVTLDVKLGSTIAISFPIPMAFSTPVPLPFSRPFSRVKLVSEKGSWLNKLLRSPTAPRPQMVNVFCLPIMIELCCDIHFLVLNVLF